MKNNTVATRTRQLGIGLATGLTLMASSVSAEGDLYFMNNGSPYFIWTDRDACVNDMRHNNNKCATIRICGSDFASTVATRNVATDMYNRNQKIVVRGRYNNAVFCQIQK